MHIFKTTSDKIKPFFIFPSASPSSRHNNCTFPFKVSISPLHVHSDPIVRRHQIKEKPLFICPLLLSSTSTMSQCSIVQWLFSISLFHNGSHPIFPQLLSSLFLDATTMTLFNPCSTTAHVHVLQSIFKFPQNLLPPIMSLHFLPSCLSIPPIIFFNFLPSFN